MKRLSLFAYLLLLLQPAFGAEVNKLLYKAVDEESITVPEHVKPEPKKRGLFGRVLHAVLSDD